MCSFFLYLSSHSLECRLWLGLQEAQPYDYTECRVDLLLVHSMEYYLVVILGLLLFSIHLSLALE